MGIEPTSEGEGFSATLRCGGAPTSASTTYTPRIQFRPFIAPGIHGEADRGNGKKSIAVMASLWLGRRASQRLAGSGLVEARFIQRVHQLLALVAAESGGETQPSSSAPPSLTVTQRLVLPKATIQFFRIRIWLV